MRISVKELAEMHGIDYADARGMVNKPTAIYELPDKIELNLAAA